MRTHLVLSTSRILCEARGRYDLVLCPVFSYVCPEPVSANHDVCVWNLQVASRKAMEDGMKALIRKTVKDPEVGTANNSRYIQSAHTLTHSHTHSLSQLPPL